MWPTTRQHRKRECTFFSVLFTSHQDANINHTQGSVFQWRAVAAKVQAALEQALLHDTVLRETLVQVHGFTVQEVTLLHCQIGQDLELFTDLQHKRKAVACCIPGQDVA